MIPYQACGLNKKFDKPKLVEFFVKGGQKRYFLRFAIRIRTQTDFSEIFGVAEGEILPLSKDKICELGQPSRMGECVAIF